jgi:phospholipase/carboxylesterase
MVVENGHRKGRLRARPAVGASSEAAPVGLRPLGLDGVTCDGYLYIPASSQDGRSAPLTVLLHGAGEDARDGLALLREHADGARLIPLAYPRAGPPGTS